MSAPWSGGQLGFPCSRAWDSAGQQAGVASLALADELFLVMLDEATGRLRVRPRLAGYGLAASLLIDLFRAGQVTVCPERIRLSDRRIPADPLLGHLVKLLMVEADRTSVSAWIEYLGGVAVNSVADRLAQMCWIRQERRLGLTGWRVVFTPVDRNRVFWRPSRLACDLKRQPTTGDLALIGLLDAVGVVQQVLAERLGAGSEQLIRTGLGRLFREQPAVALLCGQVQVLAARAAVNPH